MANIVVTTTDLDVNVAQTLSNITVTDVESNVVVTNVATAVANVTVTSTETNVNVSQTAVVSNAAVRTKLSVSNISGFGNLSYDSSNTSNGVFQYVGVSNTDIWGTITATNVSGFGNVAFDQSTGDIAYTGVSTSDIRSQVSAVNHPNTVGNLGYDSSLGIFTLTLLPSDIRGEFSAVDAGGDGSFSYDSGTGVYTYTGPSAAEVRAHLSNTSPITYDASTGVIGLEQTLDDLTLKKYQETIVDAGNVSGSVTFEITDGTVHQANIIGDITDITLANISAGGSATIFLTQDGVGGWQLDTASFTGDWQFINAKTQLDSNPTDTSVINVFYDGTTYTTSVVDYANVVLTTDQVPEGNVNLYYSNALVENYTGVDWRDPVSGSIDFKDRDLEDIRNLSAQNLSSSDTLFVGGSSTFQNNVSIGTTVADRHLSVTYLSPGPKTLGNGIIQFIGGPHNSFNGLESANTNANIFGFGNTISSYFHGDGSNITNISPGNITGLTTDDVDEGSNLYYTTDRANSAITTFLGDNANSPFVINGNLQVQGNIDYVNVEDLLVNDHSITLNYGNAAAQDAFIYVDRSGSALTNAHLKWNETADQWEVFDGTSTIVIGAQTVESVNGQTGVVELDTDDISEGTSNKYYSETLFNASLASKTTTNLTEGDNLYFTTDRANSAIDARVTSTTANVDSVNGETGVVVLDTDNIAEGSANLYYTTDRANDAIIAYLPATNVEISSDSNITTTANSQSVYDIANVQTVRQTLSTEVYLETDPLDQVALDGADNVVVSTTTIRMHEYGSIFRLTFEDITDANITPLNGSVFYSNGIDNDQNSLLLFTDAACTTRASATTLGLTNLPRTGISAGNILSKYVSAGDHDYTFDSDGRDLTIALDGETKVTIDKTAGLVAKHNLYSEQTSNTTQGGIRAYNGGSTFSNFNNQIPFVNTETGFLSVQASTDSANVYSVPRFAMVKLPDVDTFDIDNIETVGASGGEFDNAAYAMDPGVLAGAVESKLNKRRGVAIPAFGISYTGEGATLHSTAGIIYETDSSNVYVRSKESYGTIFGQPAYTAVYASNGIMKFRTVQTDILADLDSEFPYTQAMDFANSTVAYMDAKFNIGREDDGTSYSFPKTAGSTGQVLQLNASNELEFVTIAGSGTVTSVDSGNGLVGGPITTSGTLDIGAGYGILVSADAVEVNNVEIQAQANIAIGNNTTDNLTEGATNLYYSNALVDAYINSNDFTIDGNTITANAFIGGTFTGDGSDLTDVRAQTVEEKVKNVSGGLLLKGTPVYATGVSTSDVQHVAACDAGNAVTMPCIGVLATDLADTIEGRAIIAGKIAGVDTSTFTAGDSIFIAVGGGYANTAPTGEGNIIQFLGTVTESDASGGGIVSIDAPRATPNLNSGNIFIGNGSNQSVTESMNTAFYDNVVLGSNNVWLGSGSSVPTETGAETLIEDNIHNASVRLQQFRETVETTANVSGAVTFNVANGSIFRANVVGDITSLALTGVQAGTSATLILTQGATTGTLTAGASWLWAGGEKTLSTNTGDVDVISVVNDGTNYYASLTKGYVT